MVKRCSWGTCKSDSRYSSRLAGGVIFKPFPKPKTNFVRCLLWIKRCGRPGHQLNLNILQDYSRAKHLYVCSKHFKEYELDPVPAPPHENHTDDTPKRPSQRRRKPLPHTIKQTIEHSYEYEQDNGVSRVTVAAEHVPVIADSLVVQGRNDKESQTDNNDKIIINDGAVNLETLALAAENRSLQETHVSTGTSDER